MITHTTPVTAGALPLGLKAPFPWFGGKSRAAHILWTRFGEPHNYVEPFAGSLATLLRRPSVPGLETVNDLDCYVANFWRAVAADPGRVAHFADWPVNEADLHARHCWLIGTGAERVASLRSDPDFYDAKVAGWWVWGLCAWIGNGWCVAPDGRRPHLSNTGQDGHGKGIHSGQIPVLNGHGKGIHQQGYSPGRRPDLMGKGVHRVAYSPGRLPHLDNGGRGVHSNTWRKAHVWQKRPAVDTGRGVHALSRKDGLEAWFGELQARLRSVRVVCGDWTRVLTPAVTTQNGLTAVLLDPPYDEDLRHRGCYAQDARGLSAVVRDWAVAAGGDPKLRIALCGYEGEHEMPASWECVAWKAPGGYANQRPGRGVENAKKERIWFSPHCLLPDDRTIETGLFSPVASGGRK